MKWLRKLLFGEPCRHWGHKSRFFDIHSGGDGEWYVRGTLRCNDCAWKQSVAIRLPDELSLSRMDLTDHWKALQDSTEGADHKRMCGELYNDTTDFNNRGCG